MALSSIDHDFVIRDAKSITRLANALSMPKTELPKPVRSVSGEDAVMLLASKWKDAN